MDTLADIFRDIVLKFGSAIPVIGGLMIGVAVAGWAALKSFEKEPLNAFGFGFLGVVLLVLAVRAMPMAQDSCARIYQSDNVSAFFDKHCDLIEKCSPLTPGTCERK